MFCVSGRPRSRVGSVVHGLLGISAARSVSPRRVKSVSTVQACDADALMVKGVLPVSYNISVSAAALKVSYMTPESYFPTLLFPRSMHVGMHAEHISAQPAMPYESLFSVRTEKKEFTRTSK